MQHIGDEQNRQLTITEPGRVAMLNKDTVNDLPHAHSRKNRNDQRYRVCSLYFLSHHKPPVYGFYDDHGMTGLVCPEQSSPKIQTQRKNERKVRFGVVLWIKMKNQGNLAI